MAHIYELKDWITPLENAVRKATLPVGCEIGPCRYNAWDITKSGKKIGWLSATIRAIYLDDNTEKETVIKIAEAIEKAYAGKLDIEIIVKINS
jgi:hypothetical protein